MSNNEIELSVSCEITEVISNLKIQFPKLSKFQLYKYIKNECNLFLTHGEYQYIKNETEESKPIEPCFIDFAGQLTGMVDSLLDEYNITREEAVDVLHSEIDGYACTIEINKLEEHHECLEGKNKNTDYNNIED